MMVPVQILMAWAAGILVAVPSFIPSLLLRGSGHVNAGQSVVMLDGGRAGAAMSPALTPGLSPGTTPSATRLRAC